jgi:hypothetical protein
MVTAFIEIKGFGQSVSRKQMIDDYLVYRRSNAGIYESTPIYHMVPSFNTVTYVGYVEKIDTVLTPPKAGPGVSAASVLGPGLVSDIELTGYRVSPHFALSLKKIGLGFSGERGNRNCFFRYENATQGTFVAQESTLDYSGIGLNLSFLPYQSSGKFLTIATILGWKSYSARHKWSQYLTFNRAVGAIENPYKAGVRYNIERYQTGLNATLALLKSFYLIPWMDYQYTETSDSKAAFESALRTTVADPIFENDVKLFWLSQQNFNYGLDIAIRAGEFEIRLGGLLGTFGNLNVSPDSIDDHSFDVSLSWDHKGG